MERTFILKDYHRGWFGVIAIPIMILGIPVTQSTYSKVFSTDEVSTEAIVVMSFILAFLGIWVGFSLAYRTVEIKMFDGSMSFKSIGKLLFLKPLDRIVTFSQIQTYWLDTTKPNFNLLKFKFTDDTGITIVTNGYFDDPEFEALMEFLENQDENENSELPKCGNLYQRLWIKVSAIAGTLLGTFLIIYVLTHPEKEITPWTINAFLCTIVAYGILYKVIANWNRKKN
ncbi:MAG: hypothetical protein K9J17_17820 [Flavobacteriales bacterium]|nr:hypothetical protein [Flavobacteriales bacterium]